MLHNYLYGSVIYNEGTIKITNCTFINNTAYNGPVIYNNRGNISIINSNFINNAAVDDYGRCW